MVTFVLIFKFSAAEGASAAFLCCVDLCLLLSSDEGISKAEDVTVVDRNAVLQRCDAVRKYTKQVVRSVTFIYITFMCC
jgi:hypothetical protein